MVKRVDPVVIPPEPTIADVVEIFTKRIDEMHWCVDGLKVDFNEFKDETRTALVAASRHRAIIDQTLVIVSKSVDKIGEAQHVVRKTLETETQINHEYRDQARLNQEVILQGLRLSGGLDRAGAPLPVPKGRTLATMTPFSLVKWAFGSIGALIILYRVSVIAWPFAWSALRAINTMLLK